MFNARLRLMSQCLCAIGVVAIATGALIAYAESDSEYTAQTTKDTEIPVDELTLLVKPFTQSELIVEAEAWIELVKAKARQLSAAEIAVKRKNKEKVAAEELAAASEEGEAPDEEVEELAQEVQEAAQRAEQDEDVRSAVENAAELANAPDAADSTAEIAESGLQTPENRDVLTQSADKIAEATEEQKDVLLDSVTKLREERTALVDQTRTVLDDLDAKGGDTEEYRQYLSAVSGVAMDASDLDALSATILGWVRSEQGGIRWGVNIASFMAILVAFWVLSFVVGRIADRALRTRYSRNLSTLMRDFLAKLIRRAIVVVGFVIALASLEIDTGPLLAAIGAAGFVVAFALQDSLSNFASGIMILLYRPFDVGDVVETGGASGKVTSLNLVSVTIKSFDNKVVIVPNNNVWNDVITNATGVHQRRVDMVFGIGYEDDIAQAEKVLERIVQEHPLVLTNPEPVIRLHELADSSVNFICRPWVKTDDYWAVFWDVTRSVKEEFDREGISIPYPQQDVHIHNASTQNTGDA